MTYDEALEQIKLVVEASGYEDVPEVKEALEVLKKNTSPVSPPPLMTAEEYRIRYLYPLL